MTKGLFDTVARGVADLAWFFKGNRYVRYNLASGLVEQEARPVVGNWGQFNTWPGGRFALQLDAWVMGSVPPYEGASWFFSGTEYLRYNMTNDVVEQLPRDIASNWGNGAWPVRFRAGVDAAIHGIAQYAQFVWFFKDREYFRYNLASDAVESMPATIASQWGQGTWPPSFARGVDLAFYGTGLQATKIYFFSGDRYITYDLLSDHVEHAPRLISRGFPGLREAFYPNQTQWGVDSVNKANHLLGPTPLYDYVTDKCGLAPAFWGRYLSQLDVSEIQFIFERRCRILLIYNGISPASLRLGLAGGAADATRAIQQALSLGIDAGETVYGDIEPGWTPTREWFLGWWSTFALSLYSEGIYFDGQPNRPFVVPYRDAFQSRSQIPQARPTYLWSQFPQRPNFADFRGCPTAAEALQRVWEPVTHVSNPVNTGVWQFRINCLPFPLRGNIHDPVAPNQGLIDHNLASPIGFATTWDYASRHPEP